MRTWSRVLLPFAVAGGVLAGATTAFAGNTKPAPSASGSAAPAQPAGANDELAAARKTFTEALADEEAKNYESALEKFKKVQAVRDTAPVRYRIGSCLEGLGHWKQAMESYQGAIDLGGGDPKEGDVVRAARDKVADLQKRQPQLTLSLSDKAPPGAEIELDHEKVPESSLKQPMTLDPGPHTVDASAPGARPFHTDITMNEGSRLSIVVPLEKKETPPPYQPPPPPVTTHSSSRKTIGYVAVAGGVALLAGSGVVLLVRHGDIDTLKTACPDGVCPTSRKGELTSTRSRAVTEGTVSAILGIAGVVALGAGAYLVLSSPSSSTPSTQKASAKLTGYALPGGGGAVLAGDF